MAPAEFLWYLGSMNDETESLVLRALERIEFRLDRIEKRLDLAEA